MTLSEASMTEWGLTPFPSFQHAMFLLVLPSEKIHVSLYQCTLDLAITTSYNADAYLRCV
jgi:hypothetical protein